MHNRLFCGDNLEILRQYIADESVQLVYLDPPFNSDEDYNVIFSEDSGERSPTQKAVFEDTWNWKSPKVADTCAELEESGSRLGIVLRSLHTFLGDSQMMAYLVMMAPRLTELYRVLKMNGSLYLHCDSTASHYLRILLDAVIHSAGVSQRDHLEAHEYPQRFKAVESCIGHALVLRERKDDLESPILSTLG